MQFAFRKKKRIEAPVLLATMLAEKYVRDNTTVYACSQDVRKAYDTVHRHIGKEMCLRRIGVPELLIDRLIEMDRDNYTVVVTAYGLSDEILGSPGAFEMDKGLCQGSTESPDIWNAFYDTLLCLQDEYTQSDDPEIKDNDGTTHKVLGSCFADDTFWMAGSRGGMEVRLNVTALFLEFMGMEYNAKKSWLLGIEFSRATSSQKPWRDTSETDWKPKLYHTDDTFGTGELCTEHLTPNELIQKEPKTFVNVASLDQGIPWLGHQYSLLPRSMMTMDYLIPTVEQGKAHFAFWETTMSPWAANYLYDQMLSLIHI